MEPLEYLRLFRRRWRLLAACVLVAAVVALITTPAKASSGQVQYVADATAVRDGSNAKTASLISIQLFMRTGDVPNRVAKRLGYTGNPLKLARSLGFTVDDAVGTLTVTAPGSSADEAAQIANAFVEETIGLLGEQAQQDVQQTSKQLNDQVNQLQTQLADLDRQIKQATASGGSTTLLQAQQSAVQAQYGAAFSELQKTLTAPTPTAGLKVLEPASADLASIKGGGFSAPKSRLVRVVLGALLGLLLGVVLILVLERFDPRLVTREAVEAAFALPVVGVVPEERSMRDRFEVFTLTEPGSAVAEGYRSLRAALLLMPSHVLQHSPVRGSVETFAAEARDDDPPIDEPKVILVTSAAPGDGKSATVANLAAALAESGRSVLILGYDFRRPKVHRYFGIAGGRGVMDVLRGLDEQGPTLADVVQPTSVPGVFVVSHGTGTEGFGDVAASGRSLLRDARKLADVVLIDTPPLLATNDAVELIPAADTTVIVCRSNKTTRDAATRSRDLLERLGASVSGVLLIGGSGSEGSSYGDYYHYRTSGRDSKGKWARWLRHRAT